MSDPSDTDLREEEVRNVACGSRGDFMTDGERMIWAAAYGHHLAMHLDGKVPPDHLMATGEGWKRWEELRVIDAVEHAWRCVDALREHADGVAAKLKDPISNMVLCMLEKTP